jgi:hypothetical protein
MTYALRQYENHDWIIYLFALILKLIYFLF